MRVIPAVAMVVVSLVAVTIRVSAHSQPASRPGLSSFGR